MDKVSINNIKFFAYHGLGNDEKEDGQKFEVDIDANLCLKKISKSDCIKKTIDYTSLLNIAKNEMLNSKYNLIETVAEKIANRVLSVDGILSTVVRIRKPDAPINGSFDFVQVEIVREKG